MTKPLVYIDIKIAGKLKRINLYKNDDPGNLARKFCEENKLSDETLQFLVEKLS